MALLAAKLCSCVPRRFCRGCPKRPSSLCSPTPPMPTTGARWQLAGCWLHVLLHALTSVCPSCCTRCILFDCLLLCTTQHMLVCRCTSHQLPTLPAQPLAGSPCSSLPPASSKPAIATAQLQSTARCCCRMQTACSRPSCCAAASGATLVGFVSWESGTVARGLHHEL